MKRHFSILACLVLALVMVFALASCENPFKPDQPDQPEHTHSFVEGKCECGETDPNYVAPECEHAYGYEVTTEPTCTEDGVKTFTCTLCGDSYTQPVAPLGHTEETVEGKAPTCTEPGLSNGKKCTVCGETITAQNEINATGHSFVEGACSACGEVDPNYNGPKTYVLDIQTLTAFAAGAKADGETESIADFFTIYYSAKTKIDTTKDKTWSDGYTFAEGLRLNWGGTTAIGETTKNAIEINVDGTATVKVWWICGGDGREIGIFNENGDLVVASKTDDVFAEGTEGVGAGKNGVYLSELSLSKAGKYFIGTDNTNAIKNGGNIICKVEVTVTPVEEAPKNEIKVETTDTYSWIDEYTFTADAEGYYTFNLPAGLGLAIKDKFDNNGAPEIDFYENENGYAVVIGLEAGETVAFYVGALTKDVWTVEWTFEAGEVENGGEVPGPSVEIDTELELGTNSIYAPSGAFGSALECTFVVTEAGTYTFASNYLMAVITIDELTTARGQAYLEPGTYVVNIVYYASSEGYYDIDIEYAAPVTGEPNGSEQFPYIWDTIPESVVVDYDVITGKVYYTFTATADGSITFTWPVEFDSWFDYYELDANGNTTANNESGFMANSHTIVVEAGKTYRVSLGSWSEAGSHTIAISFAACNHVWSEATCTAPSTCANCGATTGDKAEHTSTVAEPDCAHPDVCAVCSEVIGYFDHTMDDGVVITPADCATGTEGSIKYTCTVCGHEDIETLYAYHEWDRSQCVEATCTTDGKYHAVCTVCGEVDSYDIEAQGHFNWYATCGDTTNCMECGLEFTVEHDLFPADCFSPAQCSICWQTFGEPLPHDYVEGICSACGAEAPHEHNWSNATCTEPAKCECGETNGEALGHDYDHITHDATCTAAGYVEHICALCDHTYNDGETEALGHADENGDYKCDRCSTKMLPEDGTALTIPQALAIAKLHAHNAYTTQKYYITGIIKSVYNVQYGNLYLVDDAGNEITIYGLYSADGKTRYDAMSYKPVAGDELTVYTVLGMYNSTAQGKNAWMDDVVAHEHNYVDSVTAPTCTKGGYTTHTCSICQGYTVDSETEALGHTTDNGECERCGLTIGGDVVNNETFTADFNTIANTNTSYASVKTTSGWAATNAAVFKGGTSDSSPAFKMIGDASNRALCINGKTSAKGTITSPTISGGISKLSLKYGLPFGDTKIGFTINIKQNGVVVASKTITVASATKLTAYTLDWDLAADGVAVSGDFVIEILNNSPSNSTSNKDRTAIWDVQWTTNY